MKSKTASSALALGFAVASRLTGISTSSDGVENLVDTAGSIPETVAGAYIVEWSDGHEPDESFYGDLGLDVEKRMDLKFQLFKGGSFRLTNATDGEASLIAQQIAARPEVKAIWPLRTIQMPVPEYKPGQKRTPTASRFTRRQEIAEDGYTPHIMAQVDKLRAEGHTGKGVRIAIVDSGIDYTHPALGGCFGEGCLVAYGWDLTGDDYFPGGELQPDGDPYDGCVGHGTKVAGIIAAQPNQLGFTGAAPDATIGAYRAWGCSGATTNDVLLAAFNRAYEDGSDIISCSAGYYTGWATDPWGLAASRIVDKGVSVVVAAGNSGREGIFAHGSPATGVGVSSVGSVDSEIMPLLLTKGSYAVGDDVTDFGFLSGGIDFTENLTLPLWTASLDPNSSNDACSSLPDDTQDLSGMLVLLRVPDNSECSMWQQADNLVAKGAQYLMYHSQDNATFSRLSLWASGINGIAVVSPAQGAQWISLLSQGSNVTVDIVDTDVADILYDSMDNYWSGGMTSLYSSWGPSWELVSKPQFTTPGANVLTTSPLAMGRPYAIFDGTSSSTPLMAAIFALVGQARGTTDPAELASVLSSTAKALPWFDGSTVHKGLAPVPQQGAGMVQAYAAATAKTVLSVTQISFNDTDNFVATHSFEIRNTGAEPLTYTMGHTGSLTVNTFAPGSRSVSRFPPPMLEGHAEITFSASEVTVPAGGSVKVTATATPPQGLNVAQLPVYSGWITLSTSNGELHHLPYMGVVGSMKDTPGFIQGPNHGTFLGYANNPTPANKTFTIPHPGTEAPPDSNVEYPSIIASLLFGTQMARADVVPLTETGLPTIEFFSYRSIGMISGFPEPWVTRRNYRVGFWGGTLADGTYLPEGTLKVVFSALRVFGDPENEEDWTFAETVPFIIKYL